MSVNAESAMLENIASLLYIKDSAQHIGTNVQRSTVAA
jgi:hypothetical protein